MEDIRIVEYGDHPHSKGLQRLNYQVARRLEGNFHSLRGLLARRFGGLPVYVGHPDDPEYAGQPGHGDTRAHGWVMDLVARPDGLYAKLRWAQTGRELMEKASYKYFSPRWVMRPAGGGVFEPVRLISLGLTNTPNIRGDAIAATQGGAAEPSASVAANEAILQRRPRSMGLGCRRAAGAGAISEAVRLRMMDTGEDFATAWAGVKRTRWDLFSASK